MVRASILKRAVSAKIEYEEEFEMKAHGIVRAAVVMASRPGASVAVTGTRGGVRFRYRGEFLNGDMLHDNIDTIEVTLKGDKIVLDNPYDYFKRRYEGTLDPTYHPRRNTNFVRYTGFDGLADDFTTTLLVEKRLLNGGKEGRVKIEGKGEVFLTATYQMTRKG